MSTQTPPRPPRDRGDDVQAIEKSLMAVEEAVTIGVFMNCDLVLAAKMVWRRGWNLVVDTRRHRRG